MKSLKDLIQDNTYISMRRLAQAIGVTRQTLGRIVNEDHKPSILVTKKICRYFKVSYKDYI